MLLPGSKSNTKERSTNEYIFQLTSAYILVYKNGENISILMVAKFYNNVGPIQIITATLSKNQLKVRDYARKGSDKINKNSNCHVSAILNSKDPTKSVSNICFLINIDIYWNTIKIDIYEIHYKCYKLY